MKSAISLIIIGICAVAYFVYISPTVDQIKLLGLQKATYDDLLAKSKDVIAKRDSISNVYNNIASSDLDKLNKIVPETFNSVLFANDLNVLASNNGLSVKDFKVSTQAVDAGSNMTNPQPANPYVTTVVTLSLAGQYGQFINFLTALESSLHLMDVVNLSITPTGGSGSANDALGYTLEINTYSLR